MTIKGDIRNELMSWANYVSMIDCGKRTNNYLSQSTRQLAERVFALVKVA